MNLVFGCTSLGLSKLQKSMYLISFRNITWGPVSIRTVLDNQGIRDFIEHSILRAVELMPFGKREKGSKAKTKQNKIKQV